MGERMKSMFKWTVCDPHLPAVVEKGVIARDAVLTTFRDFPWGSMLAKMRTAKDEDIYFSPSIGFVNVADGHALEISIVEDKKETVFYLFYKESNDDMSTFDLLDQSPSTTVDILDEFSLGNYEILRNRFAVKRQSNGKKSKPWWRLW